MTYTTKPAATYITSLAADNGKTLVEQVREYALAHYGDGGWDVVVEAMNDAEIAQDLSKASDLSPCTTLAEVVSDSVLAICVDVWADRQADARNSAF
jgi:hypothetical protein